MMLSDDLGSRQAGVNFQILHDVQVRPHGEIQLPSVCL